MAAALVGGNDVGMAPDARRLASAILRPRTSATTVETVITRSVMLDQQDGDVEAVADLQISSRSASSSGVEPRRRLIEQQQLRSGRKRPRELDASESRRQIRNHCPDGSRIRNAASSAARSAIPALPVEPVATRRHWRKIRRASGSGRRS